MNNTTTVCLEPFKNLSIEFRNNKPAIGPCCIYPLFPADTVDFVNNSELIKIRQQWINGTPPTGCDSCTEMESQGFLSRKQIAADSWALHNPPIMPGDVPTVELTRMDYWVGDICNLACVMCGPSNSSLWKQELGFIKDEKKSIINRSWENLDLSNIENIHFWGGEPFLSKEHVEFLQALPNKSKVKLYYTTNGTIQPSSELLEVWAECECIDVFCSLDDIGPRFEYIRYPADWKQTIENFRWMIDNCGKNTAFGINTTVNVLNQYYVDEITDWFATNFKHDKLGRQIKHDLNPAFGTMSATNAHDKVINHLDIIDQRRGTNWREIFPKAAEQIVLPIRKATDTFCMAPWTHTYLSPQTERRMCCASREPAQSFEQYIDTAPGSGKYTPITLEQHWNGDHMRSVRRRMMAGETLSECEVCNNKLLNTDVYRNYFSQLFKHKINEVYDTTDETGYTTMQPVSWDYRFSNLCNFKCRTCGDMLSSAWETEQKQNDMTDWANPKNNWMRPEIREKISAFQDSQIEQEFSDAVEQHRVEEIYWVGGEPLMFEQHWRYMKRIVDLKDGPRVYARYNTNLSRVDYKGVNLYKDILAHIRAWQICASLDGTGATGEYIRSGLNYEEFCRNFEQGIAIKQNKRQLRLDFTLTLPGMTEILAMEQLAASYDVELLAKVIFSFSPDIIMSPLTMPRALLTAWITDLMPQCRTQVMRDMLLQLQFRPTFEEQWPNIYQQELVKGKARVLRLESIRTSPTDMATILSVRPDVKEWWDKIGTN